MINFKVLGAAALLAVAPAFMSATADAQPGGGRGGGGGGFSRGGGGAGFQGGGGGGFRGGGMARPGFSGMNSGARFSGVPSTSFGNRAIGGQPVAQIGGGRPVAQLGGGRQWSGGGQWSGGRHWHGQRNWRGPAYGFGAGLALGAIGSSYYYGSPYYYDDSYAYAPETYVEEGYTATDSDAAYCAQRYKSYDPASGTYLNYDGNRYPCP